MDAITAAPLAGEPEPLPDFCDEKILAKRYRVSGRTIRNMTKAGRLPAPMVLGNQRLKRWRSADILEWEETWRRPARAPQ